MSSREFTEWKAYFRITPSRRKHQDHLIAMLAKVIVDINKGRKGPATKLEDFILNWDPEGTEKEQTWEEQLALVEALNAAFGGVDLREKRPEDLEPLPEEVYEIDDRPPASKDTGA